MVEFVRKTLAVKDCTLDATYSDMYDGNNPYLKIGGIVEPKKALLRFQVAAKPTFGDAELSSGEIGFYSTDLKLGTSANFPTYNLYKIKTSPDGRDWGGEGRLRPVTSGRQIVGVEKRAELDVGGAGAAGIYYDSVKVINHELSTGDRIWWSPVIARYDDCSIAGLIPEVEYYAIKIDRDNFSFAANIENAIEGTRIDLTAYLPNPSNPDTDAWGYVRSEKYNMDIHVVCATPSIEREVISENFNGSPYRETDLEFEYVQRKVTRRGEPYLKNADALVDNPNDKGTQGSEARGNWKSLWIGAIGHEKTDNLEKWYGNGEEGDAFKIWLTPHKVNSDGTGWWKTVESAGRWGGGHDYVARPSAAVKFDHETLADAVPYGDEVTPENSFFHLVQGAAEFQEASDTEDGKNEVQATGAIRLSTKKVLTGGQSCNIYQFWKLDGLGIAYRPDAAAGAGKKDRQECMMLYKGLPLPNKNWTLIDKGTHGHGLYPIDNATDIDIAHGSSDMCVSMTVNFEKLEMAYTRLARTSPTATTSDITLRRGFHVIYAAVPPTQGDSLYAYIKRLSGYTLNNQGDTEPVASDGGVDQISACGFSIVNTSNGIMFFPLDLMQMDTVTEDIYVDRVGHTDGEAPEKSTGTGNPSCITHMEEGEWYTIKTYFPDALNQQAAVVIEDIQGEPRQYVEDAELDGVPWEDNPIPLTNINSDLRDHLAATHFKLGKPWHSERVISGHSNIAAHHWFQHMSIWVTNVESAYSTGTVVGGANHSGTDWMASEDDRDTSNNIFIDRIGVTGVNLDHENATVGQEGRSRSKIHITGNKSYDASMSETLDLTFTQSSTAGENGVKFSSDTRSRRADNLICLGFEDPSQILSTYKREKSWRYLFWHGYISANMGADNKIGWTADDTLPDRTYATTGTAESQKWFSDMPDNINRSTGIQADPAAQMEMLDAGAPYTYSEDYGNTLKNSVVAFYSDNHVSHGAQLSDESLDIRELWRNHTKDDDAAHRKGAKQSMYKSVPSLGALFDAAFIDSDPATGLITLSGGPNDGNGVYWNSGQKLIYYNASHTALTYSAPSAGSLSPGNGNFNDVPTVYYWERADITNSTDHRKGYLHLTYVEAVAGAEGTRLKLTAAGSSQTHHLYDYDYYMNRKYWIDGWSSKGLSRLILEPVAPSTTVTGNTANDLYVSGWFLAESMTAPVRNKYNLSDGWGLRDSEGVYADPDAAGTALSKLVAGNAGANFLQLTKREHVGCAAKILETDGGNVNVKTGVSGPSSGYICRVDSTEALRSTAETTYRIWFAATPQTLSNGKFVNCKSGVSINIIDEEHIEILGWNGKADDNSTTMTETRGAEDDGESWAVNSLTSGLCRLWIGPEKYWVSFLIRNQSGDTVDTFGNLPLKTYSAVSVCAPFGPAGDSNAEEHREVSNMYDAWGVPGATYNESTYNADKISGVRGAYANQWSPSPNLDPNLTIYDLQDYGFGAAKEDKNKTGGENGVIGGYVGKFIPRESQVNRVKMPMLFSAGETKVEGDYIDLAIQQETLSSDAIMTVASTDNGAYPTPFLLTVFKDEIPEAPVDFEVEPNEKDAFLPEFTWTSADADLWYGFIIIDDTPINNQYHHSILHVPLDEDLSSVVSSFDDDSGWYYSVTPNPVIYGYRYYNTSNVPSGVHAGSILASEGFDKILATSATVYDNVEGLAGNTKYFDILNKNELDIGSHVQFPFDETSTSSGFTYPIDEMSVLVHITSESWATNSGTPRYIAAFNNPNGSADDVAATATITVTAVGDIDDDEEFVLVDTAGTNHTFIFQTEDNEYTNNNVGIQGAKSLNDNTAAAAQIVYAINAGTCASTITAVSTGAVVTLTQDVVGVDGNRTNTDSGDGVTIGNFTSGVSVEPAWSLYLDEKGQINATVGAAAASIPPSTVIELKSTTKVPIDGTPTCIILTVDTQLHSGNVKMYINGRLEDQTGLRGTLSVNNWPTDSSGLGGKNIFYDTDGIEDLIIGAKSVATVLADRLSFVGRIEEFVWYDKVIHPVIPQNGTFILDKPLEELSISSQNASSKSYTARLFIKDYHNIRGKTSGEVAASSQISFKKAAFELYT